MKEAPIFVLLDPVSLRMTHISFQDLGLLLKVMCCDKSDSLIF